MIKHINNVDEFKSETSEGLVLVDFFATWCGPCKMLAPVLENIDAKGASRAKIIKVDVDEVGEVAASYGIQVIPTLVLLRNGQEVKRQSGYMPEARLLDFIGE